MASAMDLTPPLTPTQGKGGQGDGAFNRQHGDYWSQGYREMSVRANTPVTYVVRLSTMLRLPLAFFN